MNLFDRYLTFVLGTNKFGYDIGWDTSFKRMIGVGFIHCIVIVPIVVALASIADFQPILRLVFVVSYVGLIVLLISIVVGFALHLVAESIGKKRGL